MNIRGDVYEKLLDEHSLDTEDSPLLEKLVLLEQNPLNIISASRNEIEQIPFVDPVIAKRIYEFRKNINHPADLLKIEGIDLELYNNVKRFITVKKLTNNNRNLGKNFNLSLRNRFINELQTSRGYLQDNIYIGSKPKIYNRLTSAYTAGWGSFKLGLVQEKDAGEQRFFDHLSGFIEFKSDRFIQHLIVGDYNLEFGQGITLWSPLGFSKGSDAVNGIRKGQGEIDPFISVNESQYFRGTAGKIKFTLKPIDIGIFGFYSNNDFDASVDTVRGELSTFYYDGNHRTDSEINRKNTAREILYGGRIFLQKGSSNIGVTYYRSKFSKPFREDNLYEFYGDKTEALGADFSFILFNTNIFGELSRSMTGAIGGVSGLRSVFFERNKYTLETAILFRYYPKNFVMLHSYGFGERSGDTKNEMGIYTGAKFKLPGFVELNVYFDQYKYPYRSYFIPMPVNGNDLLINADFKPVKKVIITAKFKSENKDDVIKIKDAYNRNFNVMFTRSQKNYRLQFSYDINNNLRVRSRFEYVFADYMNYQSSQKGILFFSDLRFKPSAKLTFDTRFIVFQTDSYDSRIYEYENELDGVMSNLGLFGKGRRWYLMLKYLPLEFVQLAAKYSETIYEGVRSIGTGYDEISGDLKNRLSLQLDIKF